MKKFIGLSGLPRSGSTLLSAILSQNANIHSEGISSVCQIMWDLELSFSAIEKPLILANRHQTKFDVLSSIPNIYYKNITSPVVIDKCRSWTMPDNLNLIKNYITANPKIIVLERPLVDIVKSFVYLRIQNNHKGNLEEGLLDDFSEPTVRSLNGIKFAKNNNDENTFLFITYDNLIDNTYQVLNQIYCFIEEPIFKHDLNNIINKFPQNDNIYNLTGLHDIRSTISKRQINIELSPELIKRCQELEEY